MRYDAIEANVVLTWILVPREVEQELGTRDGDLLSHIRAGPAGDLVPHPGAA